MCAYVSGKVISMLVAPGSPESFMMYDQAASLGLLPLISGHKIVQLMKWPGQPTVKISEVKNITAVIQHDLWIVMDFYILPPGLIPDWKGHTATMGSNTLRKYHIVQPFSAFRRHLHYTRTDLLNNPQEDPLEPRKYNLRVHAKPTKRDPPLTMAIQPHKLYSAIDAEVINTLSLRKKDLYKNTHKINFHLHGKKTTQTMEYEIKDNLGYDFIMGRDFLLRHSAILNYGEDCFYIQNKRQLYQLHLAR